MGARQHGRRHEQDVGEKGFFRTSNVVTVVSMPLVSLSIGILRTTAIRAASTKPSNRHFFFCSSVTVFNYQELPPQLLQPSFPSHPLPFLRYKIGSAIGAGAVFNVANLLLVVAIQIVGLSTAFPLGIGTALVGGTLLTYAIDPSGNPALLFSGVGKCINKQLQFSTPPLCFFYKKIGEGWGKRTKVRKTCYFSRGVGNRGTITLHPCLHHIRTRAHGHTHTQPRTCKRTRTPRRAVPPYPTYTPLHPRPRPHLHS